MVIRVEISHMLLALVFRRWPRSLERYLDHVKYVLADGACRDPLSPLNFDLSPPLSHLTTQLSFHLNTHLSPPNDRHPYLQDGPPAYER